MSPNFYMESTQSKAISIKQVEHLAELAHIQLNEEEKLLYTSQLNTILEYFRILDEADTDGAPPTFSVHNLQNVWRRDNPRESLPAKLILSNASRKEKQFIKAPRIV